MISGKRNHGVDAMDGKISGLLSEKGNGGNDARIRKSVISDKGNHRNFDGIKGLINRQFSLHLSPNNRMFFRNTVLLK